MVSLFSMLWFSCNAIFSFSFKHSEHLLLFLLYAWYLPEISNVLFTLHLLSFIFQNLLDSSVSDLRFLCLNNFSWFSYLKLNDVSQIPSGIPVWFLNSRLLRYEMFRVRLTGSWFVLHNEIFNFRELIYCHEPFHDKVEKISIDSYFRNWNHVKCISRE